MITGLLHALLSTALVALCMAGTATLIILGIDTWREFASGSNERRGNSN